MTQLPRNRSVPTKQHAALVDFSRDLRAKLPAPACMPRVSGTLGKRPVGVLALVTPASANQSKPCLHRHPLYLCLYRLYLFLCPLVGPETRRRPAAWFPNLSPCDLAILSRFLRTHSWVRRSWIDCVRKPCVVAGPLFGTIVNL